MNENIDDPATFVTVGKFMEPVNAQIAKGLLESAGIECFLQGENANSMVAFAFRARLLVHRQDEPTAREILGGADRTPDQELTPDEQRDFEARYGRD